MPRNDRRAGWRLDVAAEALASRAAIDTRRTLSDADAASDPSVARLADRPWLGRAPPAHPVIVADLDLLTEAAIAGLVPAFKNAPIVDAHHPIWDGLPTDGPDLLLGSTVVEVKAAEKPGLPSEWLPQVVGYVLRDSEDALAIRGVAFWMARWGWLVRIELGELIAGAGDSDGLGRAREKFDFRHTVSSRAPAQAFRSPSTVVTRPSTSSRL